ncbi:MAG TPA: hypothetical protein VKE95_00630 [Burkholderiales bacterium]|nr:hypothetical protein [Burkholderiales bacterium]
MLRSLAICLFTAQIAVPASALAQGKPKDDAVAVTAMRNPVDKSYRRMVEGMELFEKRHSLAPDATLRFKLLPRHSDTDMRAIQLEIVGDSFAAPLALAPDNTFALERRAAALKENASVRPNRKASTMTWRAEIRTPGLPPDTRRLGDLRLECEVGMQAGLISNYRPFLFGLLDPFLREGPDYCRRTEPRYLFFAERPIFGVTLVAGERREALPVERLYAGASRDPKWREDLAYCDCEVLVDRTYFLPLGDASWPDDTRIVFEYMDGTP